MKLADLYINKLCPHQPRYKCNGSECAKFISCMMEEIDALYAMDGISAEEAEGLDREIVKAVRHDESIL